VKNRVKGGKNKKRVMDYGGGNKNGFR